MLLSLHLEAEVDALTPVREVQVLEFEGGGGSTRYFHVMFLSASSTGSAPAFEES